MIDVFFVILGRLLGKLPTSIANEWHAFWIGFCEVIAFWRPRIPVLMAHLEYIHDEYHYYSAGRAVGVLAWIVGAILFWKVFF